MILKSTRSFRILSQILFFGFWVALMLATRIPALDWIASKVPVSLYLRADPLVFTVVAGSMRLGVTILLMAFVTLGISLVLGRVFCGWVCPLGSIFDFYSWILSRFKIKHHGPSPSFFRMKYYLLIMVSVLALLGVSGPLIGLDPIVLLTRFFASVIKPVIENYPQLIYQVGGNLEHHYQLIDFASLFLFLGIMGYTTKVSRVWCRVACPLGAYLATGSRYSLLRRDTQNCIQCRICSDKCPTGAINFKDATVYNESECIKCFVCSDECPVDANFFSFTTLPKSHTPSAELVQLDRRNFFGSIATAVVAAPVSRMESGEPGSAKRLLRPPLSREESDFVSSCIRCGECVLACPTGTLKPAGIEHGIRSLWTPVMNPEIAPCKPDCNACSKACPTDAILKYPLENKFSNKAGTAIFNTSNCISYTEGKFCSECVRVCPTDAIEWNAGWEPVPEPKHTSGVALRGSEEVAPLGQIPTRPVHVKFDACIGCGACEFACNQIVAGESAMITTSFGRAVPTQLKKN